MKPQDFARRHVREREPANLLLVGRQLDRTTFEVEAPGLKGIESREAEAPGDWCPLRRGLKDEVWKRNQRRCHREQPQPQDVADAVRRHQQEVGRVNKIVWIE